MKQYFETLWKDPKAARKAFATLIGVVLLLAANGLLPALPWVQWVVGALTVLATYHVRNRPVQNRKEMITR